ncbi:hypothetical protein Ahy_A03g016075 [Arachis hypogaea]|uniref:PB1-like domain-containing protein n=1 Tax=Arachis hypogaea TaxID=3818 RepID=A0A445E270_ARAHY|nr:hypothetical protein Ahy_A03g016075 [Arachis hypogaea]
MKRLRFEGRRDSLFLWHLTKHHEDEEDRPISWSIVRASALELGGKPEGKYTSLFLRSKVWRPCNSKMEGPPMTFIFYHGGSFKNDKKENRIYEPDNTEVLMGVDGDTLDVFFVKEYYKELGYAWGAYVGGRFIGCRLRVG